MPPASARTASGSKQIKDGQVKSVDVKDGGLLAKDFAPESISAIAARPSAPKPLRPHITKAARSHLTMRPGPRDPARSTKSLEPSS